MGQDIRPQDFAFRRAAEADMEAIYALQVQVFNGEQKVPADMVMDSREQPADWWCVELLADKGRGQSSRVVGALAAWPEGDHTHLARFVLEPELRGKHVGTALIDLALRDLYDNGVQKICMEAREVSVHILRKYGAVITGEPELFYVGTITPMTIEREALGRALHKNINDRQ